MAEDLDARLLLQSMDDILPCITALYLTSGSDTESDLELEWREAVRAAVEEVRASLNGNRTCFVQYIPLMLMWVSTNHPLPLPPIPLQDLQRQVRLRLGLDSTLLPCSPPTDHPSHLHTLPTFSRHMSTLHLPQIHTARQSLHHLSPPPPPSLQNEPLQCIRKRRTQPVRVLSEPTSH